MLKTIDELVAENRAMLKDFQAATVDYVIAQFYEHNRKKILVADEVGLGKTIIAKGVLLRGLQKSAAEGRPFHVVYICSNQVLARQNMAKLNPYDENPDSFSRLTYLALNPTGGNHPLRLSSLTPSTSFQLTRGPGEKKERAIILGLLCEYKFFRDTEDSLIKIFRGTRNINAARWRGLALDFIRNRAVKFRPKVARMFKAHLEQIPFSNERLPVIAGYMRFSGVPSLWNAIERLIARLSTDEKRDPLDFAYELVRALRYELTKICTGFLDADLFVLDEFQRFKALLNGEDRSEAGEIARIVLQDEHTRALLLSATPFKSFTTKLEELSNENHFDEFKKLVVFLGGNEGHLLWSSIQKDQEAFFEMLRFPRTALGEMELAIGIKEKLEGKMKSVMTRNERMSVARDHDNMVIAGGSGRLDIIPEDIQNYIALDRVTEELKSLTSRRRFSGSTMEFAKSTPYPLSFLRAYKLHEIVDIYKENREIRALLKKKDAFIDFNRVNLYEPIGMSNGKPCFPNAKLRELAGECFDHNGHALLWVPPSKPYYQCFGAYAKSQEFSKVLVFSGWKMVPRAVSALLSYEAERRVVREETAGKGSKGARRKYFSHDSKSQRALIVFPLAVEKLHMTNICLTYPCRWLAEVIDREAWLSKDGMRFSALKKKVSVFLARQVRTAGIAGRYCMTAKTDQRWYWLLPALMDHLDGFQAQLQRIIKHEASGRRQHYLYLQQTIASVLSAELTDLGAFPPDLFDVLSEIALSGPATVALRAFLAYFPGNAQAPLCAYQVAEGFVTLFNKPESIAIVKSNGRGQPYWRQVLDYCASGNLLSVLEEFFYLLRDCENKKTPAEIMEALCTILSVRMTSIQVDDRQSIYGGSSREMRCHFAVSYGDQKIGTDAGDDRMVNIREVFNSPFRPFVLTSTSIGQEGLDFHYYCRKIFHWNLPQNPIDLEQREGRINRYKALVIRQSIAEKLPLADLLADGAPVWETIFNLAAERLKIQGDSDMVPFWYLNDGKYKIERFVPIHRFSKDVAKYELIKETLALYRLTFGQPRQEELLEAFKNSGLNLDEISLIRKKLLIDLSP